jgi:hypothetical protein
MEVFVHASLFGNSDEVEADVAETAGSGFASTLPHATSLDLWLDALGKLMRPEVVPEEFRLVA